MIVTEACTNPEILRVIWFLLEIIDIVKIVIPIIIIVLGIIDFSKSAITNDEKKQQNNTKLFGKRILTAILIFTIPWIVDVLMRTLADLLEDNGVTSYLECLINADLKVIEKLEAVECKGKSFVFNYYDETGLVLEDSAHGCTEKKFVFKKREKPGYVFLGWASRNEPNQLIWNTSNPNYMFYEDTIEHIHSELGGFNLVPVYKEIKLEDCQTDVQKINFYDETGNTILFAIEFCPGQLMTYPTYDVSGKIFAGWTYKFMNDESILIKAGDQSAPNQTAIGNVFKYNNGCLDMIPVFK